MKIQVLVTADELRKAINNKNSDIAVSIKDLADLSERHKTEVEIKIDGKIRASLSD